MRGLGKPPTGSSPRVRGAGGRRLCPRPLPGIIPARAGSRGCVSRLRTDNRNHPRACGEQVVMQKHDHGEEGSSPRVRGAVIRFNSLAQQLGIIPARAGSSSMCSGPTARPRDHPRACGEQLCNTSLMARSAGSSPRVRGADIRDEQKVIAYGIIPARAGSSMVCARLVRLARDHPRACGEQLIVG